MVESADPLPDLGHFSQTPTLALQKSLKLKCSSGFFLGISQTEKVFRSALEWQSAIVCCLDLLIAGDPRRAEGPERM